MLLPPPGTPAILSTQLQLSKSRPATRSGQPPQPPGQDLARTGIWATSLRPTGPGRMPKSRNIALPRADHRRRSASAPGNRSADALAQVKRLLRPHQQPRSKCGGASGATQVTLPQAEVPGSVFERTHDLREAFTFGRDLGGCAFVTVASTG